jgi:hypothetical protein
MNFRTIAACALLLALPGAGCVRRDTDLGWSALGPSHGPCRALQCRQTTCTQGACTQPACPGGALTSVSGTVTDPAGVVPLYNVIVYVPNAPLDALPEGVSCDRCGAPVSGAPIATALTDEAGRFRLQNVPVGADVPLVIQVGKWRRQVTLPGVAACTDTAIARELTRLPRNRREGHIPRIGISTGEGDALECLLRKVGLEDGEFTLDTQPGRVNLFGGAAGTNSYAATLNNGAALPPAETWWGTLDSLRRYDVAILSCEGGYRKTDVPPAALEAMQQYTSLGGRVFASHYHNFWVSKGPAPFPTAATFRENADLPDPFTAKIDVGFPKGNAMANWLVNVGGSMTKGDIVVHSGQHMVDAVNSAVAQRWIYGTTVQSVQYLTFNTPMNIAPEQQCGRMILSDIHVSSGDLSGPDKPFPSGCKTAGLSPQEKALEFMLFDLSSCVLGDASTPTAPIVP